MTVCSYCGKLIWRKYWEARDVSGRFCSGKCAYHASCKKSLENSLEQYWLDRKMSEPPMKKGGIYSCLKEASSFEKKNGIDVDRDTDCIFEEMSNITGKNIRWSFNQNKVSVYYDSIVNNSPWKTGALRFGIFTSPEKGFFNFNETASLPAERKHGDWKSKPCFLWGSPIFLGGLGQGQCHLNGNIEIEIPKEFFKKIPGDIYISVVLQEAERDCGYAGHWGNRTAWTANSPGVKDCL